MRACLVISCLLAGTPLFAQRVVFDRQHFAAVAENNAVRTAAEINHNRFLDRVNSNLQDINKDMGSVVAAQTIIYEGLSNVNSALKNGMAVRDLSVLAADLARYLREMAVLAQSQPYLLLFAENIGREMRLRSAALLSDVSGCILKSSGNMLADYNSRDELLKRVNRQLQILNGLAYGAWRAMFWAKEQGVVRSLNPFAAYISNDKLFVQDIIRNTKYLKK